MGWFEDAYGSTIILPEKKLLCDVRTRLDSTFQMLTTIIDMRPVSFFFPVTISYY
jgi:hypothetical protein